MKEVKNFFKYTKKLFYDHDISDLNLNISKTNTFNLMAIDMLREKSMSEISREVGLEKSSFTRSVELLVKDGFIKRQPSRKDRRIVHIEFTEKGNIAVKRIEEHWKNYFDSLLSDFSSEEIEDFFTALKTVSKYMNRIIDRD